jgi:hypothetical protein
MMSPSTLLSAVHRQLSNEPWYEIVGWFDQKIKEEFTSPDFAILIIAKTSYSKPKEYNCRNRD